MIVNYIFKFFIAICVSICAAMPLLAVEPIDDTAQAVDTEQVQSELSEEQVKAREEIRKEWKNKTPEQRAERRNKMREHWKNMPPEERHKMREKMKEHWQKMSPTEREAKRKKMRERWEKMSSEEREQLKLDILRQKHLPYPPMPQ